MDDKIKEVMGLVVEYGDVREIHNDGAPDELSAIESKLRELVQTSTKSLLDRIESEITHAEINDHRMAPLFGKLHGEPCVRISHLRATMDGFFMDHPGLKEPS